MLTAKVTGNVWSTRRLAEIPNGAFLEVEAEGTGQRFVAFDVLGSGVGERVLIAQGSVAAAWFPGKPPPVERADHRLDRRAGRGDAGSGRAHGPGRGQAGDQRQTGDQQGKNRPLQVVTVTTPRRGSGKGRNGQWLTTRSA